jgi:hypothetical protein
MIWIARSPWWPVVRVNSFRPHLAGPVEPLRHQLHGNISPLLRMYSRTLPSILGLLNRCDLSFPIGNGTICRPWRHRKKTVYLHAIGAGGGGRIEVEVFALGPARGLRAVAQPPRIDQERSEGRKALPHPLMRSTLRSHCQSEEVGDLPEDAEQVPPMG